MSKDIMMRYKINLPRNDKRYVEYANKGWRDSQLELQEKKIKIEKNIDEQRNTIALANKKQIVNFLKYLLFQGRYIFFDFLIQIIDINTEYKEFIEPKEVIMFGHHDTLEGIPAREKTTEINHTVLSDTFDLPKYFSDTIFLICCGATLDLNYQKYLLNRTNQFIEEPITSLQVSASELEEENAACDLIVYLFDKEKISSAYLINIFKKINQDRLRIYKLATYIIQYQFDIKLSSWSWYFNLKKDEIDYLKNFNERLKKIKEDKITPETIQNFNKFSEELEMLAYEVEKVKIFAEEIEKNLHIFYLLRPTHMESFLDSNEYISDLYASEIKQVTDEIRLEIPEITFLDSKELQISKPNADLETIRKIKKAYPSIIFPNLPGDSSLNSTSSITTNSLTNFQNLDNLNETLISTIELNSNSVNQTKKFHRLECEEILDSTSKITSEAKDEKKEIHKIDKEGLVSETICEPEIKNLKLDPVITNNFSQEVKKLEISSPDLTMTQDAIAQNATFSIRLKESKETDDFKTQIAEKKSQHETFLSHIEEELITTTDTEEKNSNWPSKNDFLLALQENEIELAKLSLHLEKLAEKEEKQKTIFVENFHFSKSEYEKIDLFKKALNLYLSDFIIKNIAIARQLADPKFNLFTQVVLSSVTFLATQFIPIPFIGTIIGESSKWFIKKQKIAQAQIVTHDLHTISEAAILIEHIVELTACSFQLLISKFHPLAIDVFAEAMVIRLAFCLNKKEIKAVADLKNLQKLAEHLVMYCSLHNTADDSPIKPKADSPLLAFRESKSTENMPLYRYETTNVVCRQSPIVFFEAKLQQYFYCKTSSDIAFQTNLPLRWASDYEKDYRNLGKSIRWLGILPISPLSLQNQQIKMELSAALKKIKQLEKQLADKNLEIQAIQENVESKKTTKISNDYISTFSIRSTLNRSKSEPSFRKLSST